MSKQLTLVINSMVQIHNPYTEYDCYEVSETFTPVNKDEVIYRYYEWRKSNNEPTQEITVSMDTAWEFLNDIVKEQYFVDYEIREES